MEPALNLNTSKDVLKPSGCSLDVLHSTTISDLEDLFQNSGAESIREGIELIEKELYKFPRVEFEPVHSFAKGLYAREIMIPKGTILVGEIHKTEHLNIISTGSITILTEDGVQTMAAPYTYSSPAGTKKVGIAHEDTIWTTVHATEQTEISKIEEELLAKSFDEIDFQPLPEIKPLKG